MAHGDQRKALIVGINNYKNAPLRGCENDAMGMAKVLSRHEKGDPNFECITILGKNGVVSGDILKSRISELLKGTQQMSLFYFSGHGLNRDGKTSLVAGDYPNESAFVELSWIMDQIQKSKVAQIVLILDCCHAGGAGDSLDFEQQTAQLREGLTILAATTDDDVAVERAGNGKFTKILLRGLEGGAMDMVGHVTTASLYAYADGFLNLWEQRPVYKTNITRLTALRYCKPKVPKQFLREIPIFFENKDSIFSLDPSFVAGEQGDRANIEKLKTLIKLKSIGLVEGANARTLTNEAHKRGGCCLSDEGKDVHELVKRFKI